MPRAKPSLFLSVPNAFDAQTYSRADLITPPCYVVSCPPPLATPAIRSSSLSPNTSQSESDCELEDDEAEVSLKTDAAPWTVDQDEALLDTYSAHLDGPSSPMASFEAAKPPPSIAAKISRNAIRSHGWHGHRSVSSTRRRLLKLAREKYTETHDRMDIDPLDSSSALSRYTSRYMGADRSMARARAHPYARFNQPLASPFIKELQLPGLPLASPFHEKQFDLPSPSPIPSGEKLSISIPVVRECEW